MIHHSSFHCGGHGMTLPRLGSEEGAGVGGVGRAVGAVRGSASGWRALRSESPRAPASVFESSASRAGCAGALAFALPASGLRFARAGSSATGAPLSETTVRSLGMFDWGGTLF